MGPTDDQRTALRAMGEPAVAYLIPMLKTRSSPLKRAFVEYCQKHEEFYFRFIVTHTVIDDATLHEEAAAALGEIGPAARSAIPALTRCASNDPDEYVRERARAALMKIREDPVAPLLPLLADTTATNWQEAALTAGFLGTNGAAAVPVLISDLAVSNMAVRRIAELALGRIASQPDLAIPALIAHVHDRDIPLDGSAAVSALGKFTNSKPQVLPVLLACLKGTNGPCWGAAAGALGQLLDPAEQQSILVPALRQSLTNPDPIIQIEARQFLRIWERDPSAGAK